MTVLFEIQNLYTRIEETGLFFNQLVVVLYLFLLFFCNIAIDKIYEREKLKPFLFFLTDLGIFSIISFLFLLITTYFTNTETGPENLVLCLVISCSLLLTVKTFKLSFNEIVFIIIKCRLKLLLPLMVLSFIDQNLLSFHLDEGLKQIMKEDILREDLCFDKACYNLFLFYVYNFFNLSFLQQVVLTIPYSLGVFRLITLPEINAFLFSTSDEEEKCSMTLNPFTLIKPFTEKIVPVKNSLDCLSQRTAFSIKQEGLNCPWKVEFNKKLLSGLQKEYRILTEHEGNYYVSNPKFTAMFEVEGKKVIKIKENFIKKWEEEETHKALSFYELLEKELGKEETEKLMQTFFLFRNNRNAHELYNLLFKEDVTLDEYKYEILPKTTGVVGGFVFSQGLSESLAIISQDKANGLGKLQGKEVIGFASSLPQDASCAYTAEKLLKTTHLSGKLTHGGIPGKGDLVIKEGEEDYFYEVKDLSFHEIELENIKNFEKAFQTRLNEEMGKTTATMIYKGSVMTEKSAKIIIPYLQQAANISQREIWFFYKDQKTIIKPEESLD